MDGKTETRTYAYVYYNEDIILEYVRDHASARGTERMLLSLRYLREHTRGITRLDRITPELIERYKRARKEKVSESTVNRELCDIRTMFSYAVREGYLVENPLKRVSLYRIKTKKIPRWLTGTEITRLLEVATEAMWALIVVGVNTGLREMEPVMLEWTDVDLDEKLLFVRNKPGPGTGTTPRTTCPGLCP